MFTVFSLFVDGHETILIRWHRVVIGWVYGIYTVLAAVCFYWQGYIFDLRAWNKNATVTLTPLVPTVTLTPTHHLFPSTPVESVTRAINIYIYIYKHPHTI